MAVITTNDYNVRLKAHAKLRLIAMDIINRGFPSFHGEFHVNTIGFGKVTVLIVVCVHLDFRTPLCLTSGSQNREHIKLGPCRVCGIVRYTVKRPRGVRDMNDVQAVGFIGVTFSYVELG